MNKTTVREIITNLGCPTELSADMTLMQMLDWWQGRTVSLRTLLDGQVEVAKALDLQLVHARQVNIVLQEANDLLTEKVARLEALLAETVPTTLPNPVTTAGPETVDEAGMPTPPVYRPDGDSDAWEALAKALDIPGQNEKWALMVCVNGRDAGKVHIRFRPEHFTQANTVLQTEYRAFLGAVGRRAAKAGFRIQHQKDGGWLTIALK
jgi:hypothetical protein